MAQGTAQGEGQYAGAPPPEIDAKAVPDAQLAKHFADQLPMLDQAVTMLGKAFGDVPVAGRLRETPAITDPNRQGQDIEDTASVRLTCESIEDEQLALTRVQRLFTVRKVEDFVTTPREGLHYRGIHLVVELEGQPFEIQLRTPRQTAWADYVHDVAYATHGQTTPPELAGYLRAMSDYFAARDAGDESGQPPEPPEGALPLHIGNLEDPAESAMLPGKSAA